MDSPPTGWRARIAALLATPARRRTAWCVFLLALWLPFLIKALRGFRGDGNDFTILYDAAVTLAGGESPYGGAYMYPPFFAWALRPFTWLPMPVAGTLWALAKIPLIYFAIRACARPDSPRRDRLFLYAVIPLLAYRYIQSDLGNGNTNVMILGGLVAGLALERRPIWGAALAGAAAAIKLTPLYLVGVFAATDRWRLALLFPAAALLWIVIGSTALPGGLSAAIDGFHGNSEAVFEVPPTDPDDPQRGYLPGQSLRPFLHRWLRDTDATAHDRKRVTVNVIDLPQDTVEWMYRGVAASLALFGLWAAWRRPARWGFAWGCLLTLLISPYSRKAHFVLAIPALVWIVELLRSRDHPRARWGLGLLILATVCGQLTSKGLWGKANSALLHGAGAVTWAGLAMFVALWVLRPERRTSVNDG